MVQKTLAELLKLSPADRAELAMALWESLTDAERETELALTPEQEAVLDRRVAEHIADPADPDRARRPVMSRAAVSDPRITRIDVSAKMITAHLADGRIISVPLPWSWRLSAATAAQRAHYEIIGNGQGVHWPDVDEDISAAGMLTGSPARPPKRSSA